MEGVLVLRAEEEDIKEMGFLWKLARRDIREDVRLIVRIVNSKVIIRNSIE